MERITTELKNSGVLDEARETIKYAKTTMSSIGDSKNMGETMDAIKEILRAISGLVDELKLTVASSKKASLYLAK
jgi:hypothetical protein